MQILMSFLEPRPIETVEPVWSTLAPADKNEIVMVLARLIAKAAARNEVGVDKGVRDE